MRAFTLNRELEIEKHVKERNHMPSSMLIPNGRLQQPSPSTRSSKDSTMTASQSVQQEQFSVSTFYILVQQMFTSQIQNLFSFVPQKIHKQKLCRPFFNKVNQIEWVHENSPIQLQPLLPPNSSVESHCVFSFLSRKGKNNCWHMRTMKQ